LFEKIVFQRYFNIVYLGQTIRSSIELEGNTEIKVNELDLASNEPNRRTMDFTIKVCTNLPCVNTQSETPTSLVVSGIYTDAAKLEKINEIKQILKDNPTLEPSQVKYYNELIEKMQNIPSASIENMKNAEHLGSYKL
jgi:hypothetical protein